MIEIILAKSSNNIIGLPTSPIPWKCRDDFKIFKSVTMGHALLMGSTTAKYVGNLPGRIIYSLTSAEDAADEIPENPEYGKTYAISKIGAIHLLAKYKQSDDKLFIAGGSQIYWQYCEYATVAHVTEVNWEVPDEPGATILHEDTIAWLNATKEWRLTGTVTHAADELNSHSFTYTKRIK